jgi:microcystin-dependent protein
MTERDLQAGGSVVALLGKTGLEDNDASTGPQGENIQTRGATFFDLGTFYIKQDTSSNTSLRFRPAEDALGVSGKLRLGQYVQVGSEIMRIASSTATGSQQDTLQVIRGAFGSNITNHPTNSKVRTIDPLAIELRRSAILRASGHTFEYIGYGPGNYSTALPQLQVKQLPDNEVYLVQAQELSCGQVVYTGMSDNGDFYIGNIKYSATSGTQTTFDIPIPTIAGQLASSNSVVFDEVIINRRLFVGGGETKEILSQFDGPVKFTNSVVIQDRLSVSDIASIFEIEVNSLKPSTSPTNGALHVRGGTGIEGDLNVGGGLNVGGDVDFESNVSIGLTLTVGEDIIGGKDLIIAGDGIFSGDVILTNPDDGEVVTNLVRATDGDKVMKLWWNQGVGEIEVGKTGDAKTIFNVTKPGSGEGGEDDIDNSDGGVDIKGSLVVREKCIAKEFIGDGLGKPGSIIMWGGNSTNVPKGYVLCNGATLNKNTYSKLFKAIGYQWGGSGDNFRIPDLRDRFIVGAAGAYSEGQTGGSNTVTLTEAQIPGHIHTSNSETHVHNHDAATTVANGSASHDHNASSGGAGSHNHNGASGGAGGHGHNLSIQGAGGHTHGGETDNDGSHSHTYERNTGRTASGSGDTGGATPRGSTSNAGSHRHNITTNAAGNHAHGGNTSNASAHQHAINIGNAGSHSHGISVANNAAIHTHNAITNIGNDTYNHSHTINSTGGGQAHENRPPYFALCYIIQFK